MELARWWSSHADMVRPTDIDEKYCAADRAALYKKAPKRYERFKSEE